MKRLYVIVIACVAVALTTTVVQLNGAAETTNVTSHLQIPANSAAPVFFSDAGQSGTDAYVTMAGKNPVNSVLQSSGDWQLGTQSAARAVWLDLGDPSIPFNAQFVHALLTTHCADTNATGVAFLNAVGESTNCGMSFRIDWGTNSSVFYRIHFNSVLHPGTGDVHFTCNQVGSGGCVDWSASPADNDSSPGDGRSTGLLVEVSGKSQTETPIGYYEVNFQFHITKP